MGNSEHLRILNQGVQVWNQSRAKEQSFGDLSGADLSETNLSGADLRGTNLQRANLQRANLLGAQLLNGDLRGADLHQANLSKTDLRYANFTDAYLFEAQLRDANLQGADLSMVRGPLRSEQLAGADLTDAKIPAPLLAFYSDLESVKGISDDARKIFLTILVASLSCWLGIAATTDVNLITNRSASQLPIIQTAIPIVGFYLMAPVLVLCAYCYFHFYLQRLWEELASLPAYFPDGRALQTKVDPWLLNDLVQSHVPRLNVSRPFLSHLQLWVSVVLAWWIARFTMDLFWVRYLRRHEEIGTTLHAALVLISLMSAACLYRVAVATLEGRERKGFRWRGLLARRNTYLIVAVAGIGLLLGLISWGAIGGERSSKPILRLVEVPPSESHFENHGGSSTWVPRWMAFLRSPPFADLADAEISQRRRTPIDTTTPAQLTGVNLRFASASGAFLEDALLEDEHNERVSDLTGADLRGAHLDGARMHLVRLDGAYLNNAHLNGAFLSFARLAGAHLNNADLSGANLSNADLTKADLRGAIIAHAVLNGADLDGAELDATDLTCADLRQAKHLSPETVQNADHWQNAFYDPPFCKNLPGCVDDHNNELKALCSSPSQVAASQR